MSPSFYVSDSISTAGILSILVEFCAVIEFFRESGVDVEVARTEWLPFIVFCFGLLFGSFLNVVGYRIPRGESVVYPSSHCPHCKTGLKAVELIPVLSWLFLCGRCRTCKEEIPLRYPLVETITALLFALTAMREYPLPELLAWCFFLDAPCCCHGL